MLFQSQLRISEIFSGTSLRKHTVDDTSVSKKLRIQRKRSFNEILFKNVFEYDGLSLKRRFITNEYSVFRLTNRDK